MAIHRLRAIPLENRGIAALTNCQACLIKLRLLVYISKQGQKHLLKGAVSNDSIRLGKTIKQRVFKFSNFSLASMNIHNQNLSGRKTYKTRQGVLGSIEGSIL
jgi:hypothetical protein